MQRENNFWNLYSSPDNSKTRMETSTIKNMMKKSHKNRKKNTKMKRKQAIQAPQHPTLAVQEEYPQTNLKSKHPQKNPTTTHHHSPPPSTPSILSEKPHQNTNNTSKRFEDGDPVAVESAPGRNSVLLQLISCGNLTVAKAKNNVPSLKQQAAAVTVKGPNANVVRRSVSDLHKGVLYKTAVKVAEEEMISYMSENPRFGNLQSEEKEYFSGSIIESMSENRAVDEPALKRSNSYNEERRTKAGMGDQEAAREEAKERAARGKCIPLKKSSSSSKQTKK
ncbi:hypothetical protein OIU78_020901 [Salix suchowensis]|nr:hypothetical protein OIU78_020901 [Salix suchowensis]